MRRRKARQWVRVATAPPACPSNAVGGCSLQSHSPVGAGQVESTKLESASASVSETVSAVLCCSSRCFNISKGIPFTYSLGAFQIFAFALFPQAHESSHEPFKKESQFPIALWATWTSAPLVFQARHVGGLSLQGRSQGLGCFVWSSSPAGKRQPGEIPPYRVSLHWRCMQFGGQELVSASAPCFSVSSDLFFMEEQFV